MKIKYNISDEAIMCLKEYVLNRYETYKEIYEKIKKQLDILYQYLDKIVNEDPINIDKIEPIENDIYELKRVKREMLSIGLSYETSVDYILERFEQDIIELKMR